MCPVSESLHKTLHKSFPPDFSETVSALHTSCLKQAVAEYLKERSLIICWPPPEDIFGKLSPAEQSGILRRAQKLMELLG